jgi:hypothetical protein
MRSILDIAQALPGVTSGGRLLARVLGKGDIADPAAIWRAVPEAALNSLNPEQKVAYIETLLPLVHRSRGVKLPHLRRLYQLFTFMEIWPDARVKTLFTLHNRLEPSQLPELQDEVVRKSLLSEAIALAGRSPDEAAKRYLSRLTLQLKVRGDENVRWSLLFERPNGLEKRVDGVRGIRRVVQFDDRKLELFRQAVASVAIPADVLFPPVIVAFSVETITTGLIPLSGGFVSPTNAAMIAVLEVAVAFGVTSDKILDTVLLTSGACGVSIGIEKLNADAASIRQVLDEAFANNCDQVRFEEARAEIAEIIKRTGASSHADRVKLQAANEHARYLGERYLTFLAEDAEALQDRSEIGNCKVVSLLELDTPVIRPTPARTVANSARCLTRLK